MPLRSLWKDSYADLCGQNVSHSRCPSRRSFLNGLAALGIAALVPGKRSSAQTDASPRRIDVHHHFQNQVYLDFLKAHNQTSPGKWILAADLEDMDKNGTATSILSISTPLFGFGEKEEVRKVARECNDAAAQLRADHPGRFGIFAAIPLADTEGALREIEYALDTLKTDGVGLFSSYENKWLGHPSFAPVYEELNRRKVVAYVHPTLAPCCANLASLLPAVPNEFAMIEFGTDTTRAIADLLFSGTTTRFPDIVWIFSHAGGNMPFTIERFLTGSSAEVVPGIVTKGTGNDAPKNPPRGALYELRKMYYDTAQSSNPVAMEALRQVVPASQIVFGTDYWYRTAAETGKGLSTSKVFSEAELRAINRGNMERILPRYRS